jgi:type IV secretory pathway VirB10-like protein
MRGNRRCRELLLAGVGTAVILLLIGCDGGSREGRGVAPAAGQVEPAGKPEQAPPATAAPRSPVADVPPAASPAPVPAVPPEEEPEPEVPPPPPDYVRILAVLDPKQPARVTVETSPQNDLVISTRNVRLLEIDRERVPLNIRKSIALRLDGQVIEWTAGSTTRVFECSVNGVWQSARPVKP